MIAIAHTDGDLKKYINGSHGNMGTQADIYINFYTYITINL